MNNKKEKSPKKNFSCFSLKGKNAWSMNDILIPAIILIAILVIVGLAVKRILS